MKSSVMGSFLTCISALTFASPLFATENDLGVASSLVAPKTQGSDDFMVDLNAQRVRIPVILTPYQHVATKGVAGEDGMTPVPQSAEQHILRARLDKPNQFYVGDYRIETSPQRLIKKTGRYVVKLDIYRRYGEYGQLEESLGGFDLIGSLKKQEEGIYTMVGIAKRKFRDKHGLALLDVSAGTPAAENYNRKSTISLKSAE